MSLRIEKLAIEIERAKGNFFLDLSREIALTAEAFRLTCLNNGLMKELEKLGNQIFPTSLGKSTLKVEIPNKKLKNYKVLSVDGSQVYPDRHRFSNCYLINIGSAFFDYRTPKSSVIFDSTPHLIANERLQDGVNPEEEVNCRRHGMELTAGAEFITNEGNNSTRRINDSITFLIDGSLIFWHLESKPEEVKERYACRYIEALRQIIRTGTVVAGYVSSPKSREIARLAVAALKPTGLLSSINRTLLPHVTDAAILSRLLPPLWRSGLFMSHTPIAALYPPELKPCFFYINTGFEIARVEVPLTQTTPPTKVNNLCQVIVDQANKGIGYPIALAEAHEQAVIRNKDRELFYILLDRKLGNSETSHTSRKLLAKRHPKM